MQIRAYSDDPIEKVKEVHQVSVDIEEAIVVAYAEALASVTTVHDFQDCYAFGNSTGCVITETEAFCATCEVQGVSYSEVIETDAVARASTFLDSFHHTDFNHIDSVQNLEGIFSKESSISFSAVW